MNNWKLIERNNWNIKSKDLEIGNYIEKKEGELVLKVYKPDTIITYNWVCNDDNGKHVYK